MAIASHDGVGLTDRLDEGVYALLDRRLAAVDAALARQYPGESSIRQPVHTVYVPADHYGEATARQWGERALRMLEEHAPTPTDLARVSGLHPELAEQVHHRVRAKLTREPVEDLRIDFEDGFGRRTDEVEHAAAVSAARALRASAGDASAPPFCGIRFKSLQAATRRRGVQTLDVFLAALCERSGRLPEGFVVTLPKVSSVEQTEAMVLLCQRLEQTHALGAGTLRFELQIETPQAILGADGAATVARMIHAAHGRCAGLHYGTYDYSASVGISAGYQSMEHSAADHAKAVMQVAAAGTGVRLSDGSSNVLPAGDAEDVARAWQLHVRLVRRSLERGYYQGWDLHPAQLVSRYAATYAFFRDGLATGASRLRAYLTDARAADARPAGAHPSEVASGVLDEPATAVALAGFLLRGLDCGAIDEDEVRSGTGVDRAALTALYLRPNGPIQHG
jgi:citrate lyase beta subunit